MTHTMIRFLIHVGLPKCGSTSLQAAFRKSRNVRYLGKERAKYADDQIAEFVRCVAPFGDVRTHNAKVYRQAFLRCFEAAGNSTYILSDEMLSSAAFATYGHSNSLPQIIDNFRRVIDVPLEIVMVIREQREFLRSYFKQWILIDGDLTFDDFVTLVLLRKSRFLRPVLNYPGLIRPVKAMVENVHVLVFERLFFEADYRKRELEALGVGDVAEELCKIHERPAEPETEIIKTLGDRPATVWAQNYPGNRRNMYPDLYAHRNMQFPGALRMQRQLGKFEARHKKALAAGSNTPRPESSTELLSLETATKDRLEKLIRHFNRHLDQLDPDTDWEKLGYLT